MIKVLLDTSVIIEFLRVKEKDKTLHYKLADKYQLYVSIITHTELYSGRSVWENKDARSELESLLSEIKIIPLDKKISMEAGKLKAKYDMNLIDAIIAATSLKTKIQLVTLNTKHFSLIKGLKILDSSETE